MNMFKPTSAKSVEEYLAAIDQPRQKDVREIHHLILKTLPASIKPFLQGSIIGYGPYHYKSASGREGDWFVIGLASQKNYISVYVCASINGHYLAEDYKEQLPNANIGKSCIRFKRNSDVDLKILQKMIKEGFDLMSKTD